jgi:peptide/nickel transport system permease protein
MTRRITLRIASLVPILFVISLLTFAIGKLTPGDPVRDALAAQGLTPQQIATVRAAYGLALPLPEQYGHWLASLFTSGGGQSILLGQSVFSVLAPAFVNTLILAAAALVFFLVVGVAIGVVAGLNHRRLVDRLLMLFVQLGSNLSVYWFGLVLIWLLALEWRILPATGKTSAGGGTGSLLAHLVLPGFSAAIISTLIIARLVRAGVIEAMDSDYVRTYRSQGLAPLAIIRRHVARNVAPIIVATTGLETGALLSGVVFVEAVFDWPGIGTQLANAIQGHDYPVIQGGVILVATTFVVVNLVTDIVHDLLNPRLRGAG